MKIPKNWNSISLNTFTKLSNLVDTDNDVTNLINRLSLLTNEPLEKIKELKFICLQEIVKQEVLPKMTLKIRMELCQDLQDY